jgi:hypothetical protein
MSSPERFQRSIPLVIMTEDMVAGGYVVSLARPNANITGVSLMSPDLDGKRQDILIEAVPDARRIAVLADSNVANLRWAKHFAAANSGSRAFTSCETKSRPKAASQFKPDDGSDGHQCWL